MLGKCRLIDLSTGMPPCTLPNCTSLQHVFVECQPSSCFPPPSIGDCIPGAPTVACLGKRHRCPQTPHILQQRSRRKQATGKYSGRIDFVRLRIQVHGTLNKNRLWFRGLRLTIPWQILNGSVRWSDRRVGRGSEAMPSRYSTSSPAQIVDACIMNGDFWGDLSTDMRLLAAADRMTETERAKAIRR
ncbi:BZ3500_MvSof-1268-A1-R1_Chr7-3g09696 [Microbotryum saponariae]|uniref:BZ3500_MvSof-1268-A1-R1_Chr7-3g09696 protein n=1 Tax=Microbotryum saponariae TaxID=289078 RepID=A0A2X0MUR6_9BASI|nr:BZ3501_MvSof-1269-A2-R1_Chr7-2g09419 [Microbotryum saponariae]SDA02431.1 BZ3500_MvSof-1268-A1-R1_Chr7-3g09696 [Microbotryum saponariae]